MFTVTFTGFETLAQAREFAAWYSGSGEQDAPYWMEEHAGVSSCNAERIDKTPEGAVVILEIRKK